MQETNQFLFFLICQIKTLIFSNLLRMLGNFAALGLVMSNKSIVLHFSLVHVQNFNQNAFQSVFPHNNNNNNTKRN